MPDQPRRPLPSGERGSATIESTGVWALGAMLVAALALVLAAAAPGLGDTVRRAICIVVTLGQGDCAAAATRNTSQHVPQEPCVVSTRGHDSRVKATFLFVSASTGENWQVEELSDGRFRVTRGGNEGVGAEAGVGLTAQVTWDDKPYGVTGSAEATAELQLKQGEVYYAEDEDAVAQLLRQHAVDVAEDHTVGSSGPLRWAVDGLQDLVGSDTRLPEPSERYVEGGVALGADAKAALVYLGGDAEVGLTQVLGARIGRDGTTTEYLSATVSGEVGAGTWGAADDGSTVYAQLKAGGSVQTVVEIERAADGTVTAVRTRLVAAGEAGATETGGGGAYGPSAKGYTERTTELPIRDDADRRVAMSYLRGLGIQQVGGLSVPTPLVEPISATVGAIRFARAARERGHVTQQSFDDDSSSYGAEVSGRLVGKLGGAGEVETTSRTSTGGSYFDGTSWQPWKACG